MSKHSPKSKTLEIAFPHASTLKEAGEPVRLGWRIVLTLLLLAMLALLELMATHARAGAMPAVQSSSDPLVLAFYYSWYDETTWNYDKLSDLPAELYASRERSVMARHIEQAKAAGIDAFLVAWYGPNGASNQTEPNLTALLDEAAARQFRIGILFETDSPFMGSVDAVTSALQHAQAVHVGHPAYLRVDGRPVFFFWRSQRYDVDTWRAVRSQVDPGGGHVWIADGVDTSYLRVFDGHHLYSNTWNPPSDLAAINQKFATLVAAAQTQWGASKLWVATVMPGYNDLRIRPGSGFATDREGGGYYARAWQAAIASRPNWIVITSFNEWPEGTYIEPSAAFGDQYLGLTRGWSDQFKSGGSLQAAAMPPVAPPPTPFVEPTDPTAIVETALLNVRSAPARSSDIVMQVAAGEALPITARATSDGLWWQVDAAGEVGWVFGELVRAVGPVETVAVVSAPVDVRPDTAAAVAENPTAIPAATGPTIGGATMQSTSTPLYDPDRMSRSPYLSRRP